MDPIAKFCMEEWLSDNVGGLSATVSTPVKPVLIIMYCSCCGIYFKPLSKKYNYRRMGWRAILVW